YIAWINSSRHQFRSIYCKQESRNSSSLQLTYQWKHISFRDNPADLISRESVATDVKTPGILVVRAIFCHGEIMDDSRQMTGL
ncbi:hypothetical protein TNIN_489811, partial [Trichonephila inaurata madagascariensis]